MLLKRKNFWNTVKSRAKENLKDLPKLIGIYVIVGVFLSAIFMLRIYAIETNLDPYIETIFMAVIILIGVIVTFEVMGSGADDFRIARKLIRKAYLHTPAAYRDLYIERYNPSRRNLLFFIIFWVAITGELIPPKVPFLPIEGKTEITTILAILIFWQVYNFFIAMVSVEIKIMMDKEGLKKPRKTWMFMEHRVPLYFAGVTIGLQIWSLIIGI